MIKTLAHKRHAVGFYYLHVGVKIAVKYKICQSFYLGTRDWCEFSARNNTSSIDNRRETPGAFHYAKDTGNFGWNSNGKVRFGFFRPEYSGSPLEVVHLFRLEYSDRNLSFHF